MYMICLSSFSILSQEEEKKSVYIHPGKIANIFPQRVKVELMDSYEMSKENTIHMKMAYSRYKVLNPKDWDNGLMDKRPKVVELVMTMHPSSKKNWKDDFYTLIANRMMKLYKLDSVFLLDQTIKWKICMQEKAKTAEKAKKLFHGIVIHYQPLPNEQSRIRYCSVLDKCRKRHYDSMTELEKLKVILERNKSKWKKMLIITDCTTSMLPYGAEVALWHLLQDTAANVRNLAFFNDGDGRNDASKIIGKTGGVHIPDIKDPQDVINTIRLVVQMGKGNNDVPENDAEAIIKAMEETIDYDDVVLIADNNSPIRDIELLNKINKPIRIVLCGVGEQGIHYDYIKLAFQSKGTLHTVRDDIYTLVKVKEGDVFKLDGYRYKIIKGNIVCLNENKGL